MKIYDFYENFANVLKSQPKIRSNVSKKEMNLKVNQNFLLMLHEGTTELQKFELQKKLFTDVLQNRCSYKFRKFHRKTPVLESLFPSGFQLY